MLFLLSPAKALDFDSPHHVQRPTTPSFMGEAAELIGLLKALSPEEVAALMRLSPALAALNVQRYADWRPRATARNSKPALLAFNGDVYDGLGAASLDDAALAWAQQHLAILSGLYGVLRPLDRLQPYRLEMGSPLATARGRSLYDYWGDRLAVRLNRWVQRDASPVIINLASQEYFKAVNRPALKPRVIDCVFEEARDGGYQVIGFFAKRARGLMARHAICNRVAVPEALQDFNEAGYAFAAAASSPSRFVFRRERVPGVASA